jgi:hypothetical protein
MARKYTETKTVLKSKTVNTVICNSCGKTDSGKMVENMSDIEEWSHSFGYGSRLDCMEIKFDLCTDCYEKIISTFKIKPEIENN